MPQINPAMTSNMRKRRQGKRLDEAGRERRHGAAAGDEACDDDQVAAALVERLLRPFQALLGLLAREEATLDAVAEEVAEREADVVADDRAERGGEDAELDARPPVPATPAAIAVASLGTIGKNASIMATAKTIR